ncbi:MAG: glucoamylase family protein [Rudaea sp.]
MYSSDQMEQHGEFLAESHVQSHGRGPDRLLPRLADNEAVLTEAAKLLTDAIAADRRITPAGEWLLDNFYIIQEQIRTARRHLPKSYSWELPRLETGASAGFPRVYDIASEAIAHGDGRVTADGLIRFVSAYQRTTTLTLGELWAIPIMLRLALIENLRRVAANMIVDRTDRNLADAWSDRIVTIVEKDSKNLIIVVADMARSNPPMRSAFVAEFVRRLQSHSHALALPLTWIEQSLAESGSTIAQSVQAENQQQAAEQVSMSNSIGSLRALSVIDWREFVESLSAVDEVLRRDPADVYTTMDFATRDRYRHVVEAVAKRSEWSEHDVAAAAWALATQAADDGNGDERLSHVGYYLIDAGLSDLEQTVDLRVPMHRFLRHPQTRVVLYLVAIFLITVIGTTIVAFEAHADHVPNWLLVPVIAMAALCASQLGVAVVNRLTSMLVSPRLLPRLDFSEGVPAEVRTLVVVPTLISDADGVEALLESIEIRFLANRDTFVHFALLTDFSDAPSETMPNDESLLQLTAHGIEALNKQYEKEGTQTPFFLLHRPRVWNSQERTWMGRERKRGKLGDLNAVLRGKSSAAFSRIVGDTSLLPSIKYVITLDTDTQLPRDTARQLIATLSHPLNRAHFDATRGRVVAGYGILQPRVAVGVQGAQRSEYARMHSGDAGIDPYTRAVSNVYQDAFGEGSFVGKGIYDVDAFEQSLEDRLPANRILSHDLLEGCYARSGLVSDVELAEDYPSSYLADVRRRHRWIRGDWQITRWLTPFVSAADGRITKNPLSALSRWKVLDNLRRSLLPTAATVLLVLGWTVLSAPWFWTAVVAGVWLLPLVGASALDLSIKPKDLPWNLHLVAAAKSVAHNLFNALFALACLPYEMAFSLDAIVRTGFRMLVSRRYLLQWTPFSDVERRSYTSILNSFDTMWIAPSLAMGCALYLAMARPSALIVAAPLLTLWLIAPAIEWWLSRPLVRVAVALTPDERGYLRNVARRTWAFFENLVVADDNWLPPDNFQETPLSVVAHRTSPTNIGLALLSNFSAFDFGFVSMGTLIERCGNTLDTMQKLDRERGHFYNWYDTQSLKPLNPVYVSTVDSGNLCAHLFTLHAALRALPDAPVVSAQALYGLIDIANIVVETRSAKDADAVSAFSQRLERALVSGVHLVGIHEALTELAVVATAIAEKTADDGLANAWPGALLDQCLDARDDLRFLLPWLESSPMPARVTSFLETAGIPTLADAPAFSRNLLRLFDDVTDVQPAEREWLTAFENSLSEIDQRVTARLVAIRQRALQACHFAQMDFGMLYDKDRHLLTIGYYVADRRTDASFYDLLASEARLTNFVAVALGQVPQESWFALGRLLTKSGGDAALLSWGGSMFEYLMPLLVMPNYPNTLLDQTYTASVKRQIDYGRKNEVPWGISESGYNAVDAAQNYQYRAFGVPSLGLKRGLAADLVVTPHASVLAAMVEPQEATRNLRALESLGLMGQFGFYEAADYTPSRLRRGEPFAIVRSFMAHHQGMSMLALAETLLDRPMCARFVSEPLFAATLQLLQERVPRNAATYSQSTELAESRMQSDTSQMPVRVFTSATTPTPAVQMLSNGRYHVMLTNAGGGFSRWKGLAVTRWREDTTRDNWGTFCYIRDVDSGKFWSNTLQPVLGPCTSFEATFTEPRVQFQRRDDEIDTHTDIAVSPEDDIELRRVKITNRSRARRTIEVTSYAEVVLAPAISDDMGQAFSNLFVETEIVASRSTILCKRRPRSNAEQWPSMLHLMSLHGAESVETSYETDRMRFIGRGNSSADPTALRDTKTLSGTQGAVLDPIVAVRHRFVLEPKQSATLDIVTGIADGRTACIALAEKYHDLHLGDRVFDLAWTHSQVALRQINVTETDAQLYGRLAGRVIYANGSLRAGGKLIAANRRGQSGLWRYAISGDLPILLLQISDFANIELARQLVQAHAYWRTKGLSVDLIILNDDHGGYRQVLQEQILGMISAGIGGNLIDRPGGIFVRPAEQIAAEDRALLLAVSRAIISDLNGSLGEQIKQRDPVDLTIPRFVPTRSGHIIALPASTASPRQLLFDNGTGGFSTTGREYVITTTRDRMTPLPWANVLANPNFGSVVSESGGAYTWAENAHEYRLSPWANDPVGDASGEAFYLRDEETGRFWSPTPLPCRGETPYTTRHGFGYTVFEHTEDSIQTELWIYVALDAPVKFSVFRVRNLSGRARQLSLTGYVEWALGDLRPKSAMHVVTEIDPDSGALFARNSYNSEFSERVAFFDVDDPLRTLSGDRTEFIGRNGSLQKPAALSRSRLSGKVGAALDPCAALQTTFDLADGQSREIIFRLGAGEGVDETSDLVLRLRKPDTARAAFVAIRDFWKRTLGVVHVKTPKPELDVMANGWLLYQAIACRMWGRSGYYQSGGAYGFRDQLQDAMALVFASPDLLREQILRSACRQFKEGDVQHWWHPPSGRGVRTRCSDDYLWLPLATWRYVMCTGDRSILNSACTFLEGRPVSEGEESYYDLPTQSGDSADLYEHCVRAIKHGLDFGVHGLPLMGSGDWNDGMNNVGAHGKGESVWLAFFLHHVLTTFSGVAERRGDIAFAARCRDEAATLSNNIEANAWDGAWYRRAYFDDGSPLGSSTDMECKIDSIAQSWSVLSGAGSDERRHIAMMSLDKHLVDRKFKLVKLLDPPFDKSPADPGYIKGYVPGVRENGGQYTHAAIWASMAFAALGDAERANELLGYINPVGHALSAQDANVYKVEPYVVTADVYAVAPHTGRGGWSWYTGSAGWLYRLMIESILGLRLDDGKLHFAPCVPADWTGFSVVYTHGSSRYDIEVTLTGNASDSVAIVMDDIPLDDGAIELTDDGKIRQVRVMVAASRAHITS